jgi:hypothetical protein
MEIAKKNFTLLGVEPLRSSPGRPLQHALTHTHTRARKHARRPKASVRTDARSQTALRLPPGRSEARTHMRTIMVFVERTGGASRR